MLWNSGAISGGSNSYLELTFLGGLSTITVWPSHIYPKINKLDDFSFSIESGIVAPSAFDYQLKTREYRNLVSGNLSSVWTPYTKPNVGIVPNINSGKKNYNIGTSRNYVRQFTYKSLGKNVIDNSFKIDIPVVTAKNAFVETDGDIFVLSFFSDRNSRKGRSNSSGSDTASPTYTSNVFCLSSEVLSFGPINNLTGVGID